MTAMYCWFTNLLQGFLIIAAMLLGIGALLKVLSKWQEGLVWGFVALMLPIAIPACSMIMKDATGINMPMCWADKKVQQVLDKGVIPQEPPPAPKPAPKPQPQHQPITEERGEPLTVKPEQK